MGWCSRWVLLSKGAEEDIEQLGNRKEANTRDRMDEFTYKPPSSRGVVGDEFICWVSGNLGRKVLYDDDEKWFVCGGTG